MKKCNTCCIEKNVSKFSKSAAEKDGLQRKCKECAGDYRKKYALENPEYAKKYATDYYEQHAEEKRPYFREYAANHREERSAYGAKYRVENPDKLHDYGTIYREEHADKIDVYQVGYRAANREKILEHGREYSKTLSAKFSSYKNSARVRGISWNLSFEEFSSFWQKPCYYTGIAIATIGLDRKDSAKGYELENVVSCCKAVNYMKRSLSEKEFIEFCRLVVARFGGK